MNAHFAAGRLWLGRVGLTGLAGSLALSLALLAPSLSSADEVGSDMPDIPGSSSASAGASLDAPSLPTIPGGAASSDFDWVQMASGEWIKGEIQRMHDDKLKFDSDEFGMQSLDWGDVSVMVPAGPLTLRLPDKQIAEGIVVMQNGTIAIDTGTGVVQAAQSDVISITAGKQREINYWYASASVGFSARSGNTKQTDVNLRADVMRQTTLTRTKLGYLGAINSSAPDGFSPSVTTANNHRVPASFDYFLTDRFFLRPISFEYFTDEFSNIDRRITVGAGLGYEAFSNSRVNWEFGGGAAYQNTGFNSVVPPQSQTANDAAITFGTLVELDLPRGIEWDNGYNVQVVVTDIDKTSHHVSSILSFDIWGPLEFEAAFYFDRIEQPVFDPSKMRTPKSNDYRMTFGLAFDI